MRGLSLGLGFFLLIAALAGCDDPAPTYPDAGLPLDQCSSASDMDLILASRVDAGPDASVLDPLEDAYQCSITPDCYALFLANDLEAANACVDLCLESKPSAALTDACRGCYTDEARTCATANCLLECLGADHTLCEACFAEHCQARLDACVGY